MCLQDFFAKWGQEGTIDFARTFSELIILTASRTLMGAPCWHCMPHVWQFGYLSVSISHAPLK